jgi:Putative beta barrel porin-7 (BBP7)
MMRWWMSLALAACCLGWSANLPAQTYMPSPVGPARMPEPTPTAPSMSASPAPPLIAGPITAQQAPPGPPDSLSLPENHSSAFQAEECPPNQGCYFHLGAVALERDHLSGGGIVFNGGNGSDFLNPLALPPTTATRVYGFDDINQPMNLGMRGTLGYYWNGMAIEASVLGIFENNRTRSAVVANSLFVPFTNAPQGFQGDNGLWMEADGVRTNYRSWFVSPELNYRFAPEGINETQLLMGVRFVTLQEKLGIATVDDVTTPQDPTLVAAYTVQTRNNIIAPQIGFDYSHCFFEPVVLGLQAKAAPGVNFAQVQTQLVRGDGLSAFSVRRDEVNFGGIVDVEAYIQFDILERLHLRAGYTALWFTGLNAASEQVDFNLANPSGKNNNHGNAFYYGPSFQFEFFF